MIKEQSLLIYCVVRIDRWPNGVIDLILMCLKRVNEPKAIFNSCEKLDFCVAFLQQWGTILTALHWFSNQPWPFSWQKAGSKNFYKGVFLFFSGTAQTRLNVHNLKYPSVFSVEVFSPEKSLWVLRVLHFQFCTKWKDFVRRIMCIIKIMRIKFPHISPPIILAYIIVNKALFIPLFKLWVGIDSLFHNMK